MLSFKFQKIYILESLRNEDFKTYSGESLFKDLKLRFLKQSGYTLEHTKIKSKIELIYVLRKILAECQISDIVPIIHFSFHGYEGGITISPSNSEISWEELKQYLLPINIATRLNLMVNFSSCYGQNIYKVYDPEERAVFLLSIGPKKKINPTKLYQFYLHFYDSLVETREIVTAIESQGELHKEFLIIFDFSYFLRYLETAKKSFGVNRLKSIITQKTNKLIKLGHVKKEDKKEIIDIYTTAIKNRMILKLAETNMHHFMIDLYPENAERFRVDKYKMTKNRKH